MNLLDNILKDPRARLRNDRPVDPSGGAVVYWMQRAQRGTDNPALDTAIGAANELKKPLAVFLGLVPFYPNANERHYAFLIDGLADAARQVEKRGAAFVFRPYPRHSLVRFCGEVKAALVIGDENPMREPERWRQAAGDLLEVPLVTVDADVIVPTSLFPKEEYAARTIRPKVHKVLDRYLVRGKEPRVRVPFPASRRPKSEPIDKAELLRKLPLDRSATPVEGVRGGAREGTRLLKRFVEKRLAGYDTARNRPENPEGTSGLSAYIHFGHLGPRQVALAVKGARASKASREGFLEQLIVRRELAINFVARNPDYDSVDGFHDWARRTLRKHEGDKREHLYVAEQLETGETHDPLWNAAQMEMVLTGFMHGYLRMYWAKKILEWTRTPEEAMEVAIRLNDRYELDGRDPNGYAGIAWAIGGKHDRPWGPERPIFGLIRFMSFASTSRKFGSRAYMERIENLVQGRLPRAVDKAPGSL